LAGQRVFDVLLTAAARIRIGQSEIEMGFDRLRVRGARWGGGPFFGDVIAHSSAMQRILTVVARGADGDTPVLIRGESGSGKEVIARALHAHGPRKAASLVVVDCAALSTGLAELELFGHVRGAFTGATSERPGVFERASSGTLLLDHVDALPMALQPLLLRALDRGEVRRIGDDTMRQVDVRVIATTQQSLERLVNAGAFREDLMFRLAVLEVRVPPLRERREDLPELASRFLSETGKSDDPAVAELVAAELGRRDGYAWPGNARELRAVVRRIAYLGSDVLSPPIQHDDRPEVDVSAPYREAKERWIAYFERSYFTRLLEETGGNVAEAARRAGVNRSHLHEVLKRIG
jgi:DNA-binding NtrC family response regulator